MPSGAPLARYSPRPRLYWKVHKGPDGPGGGRFCTGGIYPRTNWRCKIARTMAIAKNSPSRQASRGGVVLVLLLALGFVVLLLALYTYFTLHWSYSEGERAGILQKFSRRGWVFKTYEGELAMSIVPGVTPTIWDFSVRDRDVARELTAALGKRVVLHYTEHRGVPTAWFAETSYFVDSFRLVE